MADIHRLSSEERRIYLSDAKSSCADEEDYSIMHRSRRARMDNYDEGDIFDSVDEKEKEHSSEEESNSEENENSEEDDRKEEGEDGEHESSEDGEDYDPWQTLIHEARLQLSDKFQENVECLNN